jgi:hypothetical protein
MCRSGTPLFPLELGSRKSGSSRPTKVDTEGIEPSSLACKASVIPLDHAPDFRGVLSVRQALAPFDDDASPGWIQRDLNSRPPRCERGALPAEL